jgi:polyferredoxin
MCKKVGGRGMKLLKKQREKQMNNKEYSKYIFWIVFAVIALSTLTGS